MRYRIIKRTTTNGLNKQLDEYFIQKKFLFLWIPVFVRTHYFTHRNFNCDPISGALLIRRNYIYDTEEMAKHIVDKLSSDRPIYYQGCKIIRVFNDSNMMEDHYINKSCYRFWDDSSCYEWSDKLDDLKKEIDKRTNSVKEIEL